MEYEDNLIQLIDEDGEELNFEHIMTLDYKDKQYIVLTPADDDFFEGEDDTSDLAAIDGASEDDLEDLDEEEGELIILEVSEDEEGNELFLSIEDDDLLDELYNGFASEIFYSPRKISTMTDALASGSIASVADNVYNIFEQPILAIRPVASNLRRIMLSSGALGAMMSGSGPSVFGIFDSNEKAYAACETIKKIGVTPHVCRPVQISG